MIRDLNLLGLDEQYTTFSFHTINLPVVFPKTTDKEAIKYLVSLGYTCVFDKILKNSNQHLVTGIWILIVDICTLFNIEKYLEDNELVPLDSNRKNLFININGLYKMRLINE